LFHFVSFYLKETPIMFSQLFFNLVERLVRCRWATDYTAHDGRCEESRAARLGPLQLELNDCFVLDHRDAAVSLTAPTFWGRLRVGCMVCLGEEQVRQPGFFLCLPQPLSARKAQPSDDYFPL
jgi:hypothetical protein